MAKREAKFEVVEMTINDAVGEAFSKIEALTEEMEQWRDNMEERLSDKSKYDDVSAVADDLSTIQAPILPGEVVGHKVTISRHLLSRGSVSHAERRDSACAILDTVIAELHSINETEPLHGAADRFRDDLDNVKCEVENVTFPVVHR